MLLYHLRASASQVRCLSSAAVGHPRIVPWFISPDDDDDFPLHSFKSPLPVQSTSQPLPIPEDAPDHLRILHSELGVSPYLETSSLTITRPIQPISAPPLPFMRPRGVRRPRGGTDAGIGIEMPSSGPWSWLLLAQVKEGSERKGSIERVVKDVRRTLRQLAARDSSLALPPNKKQSPTDGWVMLDVGDFAVHILSRAAREKWFSTLES